MRKYFICIISILLFLVFIILLCFYYNGKIQPAPTAPVVSTDEILANSEWIKISAEDIDLLSNEIYTPNINTIINSLECGIPVILKIEGGKFDETQNGTYITLSAFNTDGNVIVYTQNGSTFQKSSIELYLALEDATSAFIITNEEILS